MKEVKVIISVLYRDNGKIDTSKICNNISDVLLKFNREHLFNNNATYAGYNVVLEEKHRKKIKFTEKISKSNNK